MNTYVTFTSSFLQLYVLFIDFLSPDPNIVLLKKYKNIIYYKKYKHNFYLN